MEDVTQNPQNEEVVANPTPGVAEQAENALPDTKADQQEWDDATDELFPGINKPETNKPADESQATTQTTQTTQTTTDQTTTDQTTTTQTTETTQAQTDNSPEAAVREARNLQRHMEEQVQAVENDIREVMFKDVPTELRDSEGNPIRSHQDIMNLVDPRTGRGFTEADAKEYYDYAQGELQKQISAMDAQVKTAAATNISIKDQADVINEQYGDLLRSMPEVKQNLWAEFQKTLKIDPKSGTIVEAPISLESFYRMALQPYSLLHQVKTEVDKVQSEAMRQAEEAKKQAEEVKRAQTRSDRSDIYAAGKVDTRDEEQKEWDDAAKDAGLI